MTAGWTKEHGDNRRAQILRYIRQFHAARQYAPTIREIGIAVGITSSSLVRYHLHALREAGLITFVDGQPRTIVVTEKGRRQS